MPHGPVDPRKEVGSPIAQPRSSAWPWSRTGPDVSKTPVRSQPLQYQPSSTRLQSPGKADLLQTLEVGGSPGAIDYGV